MTKLEDAETTDTDVLRPLDDWPGMAERHVTRPSGHGVPGFTLIELLVVLGIMGLLVTMSVPSFIRYAQQVRLKTAAREVMGLLSFARQSAISMRKEKTILVDGDLHELSIEESLDDPEPRVIRLPNSVAIDVQIPGMDGASPWRFAFQPSGALSGRSVSVVLGGQGRSQTISVTAVTGSIAIAGGRSEAQAESLTNP